MNQTKFHKYIVDKAKHLFITITKICNSNLQQIIKTIKENL